MNKAKGKDHTKYCWSCGQETMQPVGSFYRCTECGATYSAVSLPSVHYLRNKWTGENGLTHWHPIGVADY